MSVVSCRNFAKDRFKLYSQGHQVPPKHHHSAVVHGDSMWVFGGMSDLQERSDCWRFDFGMTPHWIICCTDLYVLCPGTRCWHPVRSKPGPGCLHSHAAVALGRGAMVVFGGEREGQTVNEVWRLHFGELLCR